MYRLQFFHCYFLMFQLLLLLEVFVNNVSFEIFIDFRYCSRDVEFKVLL